jgi:hypothetical protein
MMDFYHYLILFHLSNDTIFVSSFLVIFIFQKYEQIEEEVEEEEDNAEEDNSDEGSISTSESIIMKLKNAFERKAQNMKSSK